MPKLRQPDQILGPRNFDVITSPFYHAGSIARPFHSGGFVRDHDASSQRITKRLSQMAQSKHLGRICLPDDTTIYCHLNPAIGVDTLLRILDWNSQ